MIQILFYGNCQTFAVKETLCLPLNAYKIIHISCHTTDINKEEFTNTIKHSKIIVTQPIHNNYRNKDYLSTNFIIENANPECQIIIFDSCRFDFYYVDLTYKQFNNDILNEPIDYHYDKMIECYKNNHSIEYYTKTVVNNEELKTTEELETIANNSLEEMQKRYRENKEKYNKENVSIISIYEFVKNNYKNILLFYSMNHPTKYVIQYICQEIINILRIKNTIHYEIDVLAKNARCILYKCIQKNVTFDISQHQPQLFTNKKTNLEEITQLYYDTYKRIGFS
jgi:hypothetical protein